VVFLITLIDPLSLNDKKGGVIFVWTRIVFLTGQVIFVLEWPKGDFVSFCVGCILLDKITSM
jgi:hypothetical protein